jgi:hypothetical protein
MSETHWVTDEQLNLLSEANLARVRQALSRPNAVIFGWRYLFAAGTSRSPLIVGDFDQYERLIQQWSAGDHITLYDFDAVQSLALIHLRAVPASTVKSRLAEILGPILIDPLAEVTVVGRGRQPSGDSALMREMNEPTYEDWQLIESWYAKHGHEIAAFNTTIGNVDNRLDSDDRGQPIPTVTQPEGRRRIHALVDAKRPNTVGLVPRSGAY